MDKFEECLRRQSLKEAPRELREEILVAASEVGTARRAVRPSALDSRLSTILWPSPAAWAGLAAIWILIFAVDFSVRDKTPVVAEKSLPPSPEVIAELWQQQRLLAELIGPRDVSDVDRSKSLAPRPRSECAEFVTA